MDKTKNQKEKRVIYILVLSFILSLTLLYSMMNYKNHKEINQFLTNTTLQQEKIYNAVYDEFKTLTNITYMTQLKNGICSETLYKVKHNLEDKEKLRNLLYQRCRQNYDNLKEYKLKQLHFHTSEGKSFLRMNNPDLYNDDLKENRPMISQMVRTKKFITGYEEGKYSGGYRYLYPVFYENEYVGSVEYVFSSLIISKRFMDNYHENANFLINEKVLSKYDSSPKSKGYTPSHIEGFYVEKQFYEMIRQNPLSEKTIERIIEGIKDKEKFSLYDKKNEKIVTLFKISSPVMNETEGLFLIRYDASYIYNKNRNFMFMFSVFTFFILTIHYFLYLHLINKIQLEIKIEEAVIEARQKDKRIQKNERMAAMGEMIDSIAHQWKQPISVIKMCLDMITLDILRGTLDEKYINKNIETSNLQIDHLIRTIDEFRNFFKPNKNIEQIHLKSIVDSALLLVKDELSKNSIVCDANLEEELTVNINKNEFVHVIINLINNAKDAFNENGISNRHIDISTYKEEEHTVLKVCDNAGGIPESIIDKIFDSRFTTKEHIQGSGIGLYMSKQILEKYNSKIEVYNTKNGACFRIVF